MNRRISILLVIVLIMSLVADGSKTLAKGEPILSRKVVSLKAGSTKSKIVKIENVKSSSIERVRLESNHKGVASAITGKKKSIIKVFGGEKPGKATITVKIKLKKKIKKRNTWKLKIHVTVVEGSASPTVTPSASPTVTPSASPTVTPSASPTVTPSASPTVTPSATPTVIPSASPTVTPVLCPSQTPARTATPTQTPAPAPTGKVKQSLDFPNAGDKTYGKGKTVKLFVGIPFKLEYVVTPANPFYGIGLFAPNNNSILTIDGNGFFTVTDSNAFNNGILNVNNEGVFTALCRFDSDYYIARLLDENGKMIFNGPSVRIEFHGTYGVAFKNESIQGHEHVTKGDTIQLVPKDIQNRNNLEYKLVWESENEQIATVDGNGFVTGVSEGETEIYAYIVTNDEIGKTRGNKQRAYWSVCVHRPGWNK